MLAAQYLWVVSLILEHLLVREDYIDDVAIMEDYQPWRWSPCVQSSPPLSLLAAAYYNEDYSPTDPESERIKFVDTDLLAS